MDDHLDSLEQYVLGHRDEFDLHEPPADVWNRIERPKAQTRVLKISWRKLAMQAAAAAAIFVASFYVHRWLDSSSNQQQIVIIEQQQAPEREFKITNPELREAEAFYSAEVDQKLTEFKHYAKDDPELTKEIERELQALDSIYIELSKDLEDDVSNEAVIEAMIQNYRLKVEILEEMLYYLKKNNNPKEEDDEDATHTSHTL